MRRKPNPIAASALAILLAVPLPAYAQPSGGSVVVGGATITTPSANSTIIKQTTQSAIVNWQSFSIETGSSVQFNQPNAAAITLNRVLGGGLSQINGALTANGQVWIINQNGILFGKGSQVNVSGLLATTSDIADADFSAGNYNFNSASPNAAASIDNAGTIHVGNGGSAVLSASHVGNTGLIQADAGQIVLGGANAFTVDFDGDNLLRYSITTPVASTPIDSSGTAQKALVENSGTLSAAGGRILMTARAAANVADNVVNNTGLVSASSASLQNGEVVLDAGDGSVQAGGTISATGNDAGQTGGKITLAGSNVAVTDGAVIDASGDQGGGTISIGAGLHGSGSYAPAQTTSVGRASILADAHTSGNGGTVSIWSTGNTNFAGAVSARGGSQQGNGGNVETSGHVANVASNATVDTTAPRGTSGNWLLDPTDLTIVPFTQQPDPPISGGLVSYGDTRSVITSTTIVNALTTTNVTLQATNNIFVFATIVAVGSGHTLELDAGQAIYADFNMNLAGNSLRAISGGNLTIGSGVTIGSSAAGDAIVLSAGQSFINNSGSGALSLTGGGRFLIYSLSATGDTFGALNSGNTAIWGTTYPTTISASGNRYIFATPQTLTFTSTNQIKTYGVDASTAIQSAYTIGGYATGLTGVYLSDSAATAFGGAPLVSSLGAGPGASVSGGPYQIGVGLGSLTSAQGMHSNSSIQAR